jgi:hypothetical protein
MQVCTIVAGQALATTSGWPLSPSQTKNTSLQLVLWELIAVQRRVLWLRWPSEEPGSRRIGTIGLGILLRAKGQ